MGDHPVATRQHLLRDVGVEALVRVEQGHAELGDEQQETQRQQDVHDGLRDHTPTRFIAQEHSRGWCTDRGRT
jgi:hypothetical protein